jgi:arylsulfatase A-like enzyme
MDSLKTKMNEWYGKDAWIVGFENQQIYFNHKLINAKNMNADEMIAKCYQFIKHNFKQIQHTYLVSDILKSNNADAFASQIKNGIVENRCGDIYILFESGWLEDMPKGTSHGTFFAYDTHVPLLWWGFNLKNNKLTDAIHITDIAPTLANILKIQEPSGTTGAVINLKSK